MTHYLTPLSQPTFRLGALVPPANPTVEIEYSALLPAQVALHSMRLPVIVGDLATRNRGYVDSYANAIKGFGTLKLDAITIAMTGPQYRLGYQGDSELCQRLSEQSGLRVETASLAICHALRALGVEHISLISPYPDWLTELARTYWLSAGFHLETVTRFKDDLVAYSVSAHEVASAIKRTACHPLGAIVLSGTGMTTLDALAQVKPQMAVPLLSSNLCAIWSLLHADNSSPSAWMQAVLPSGLSTAADK
ncbi:hypothetical protein [Yersinia intermedia]|uniref:maleate cis-trans isomerase family protein n=1 Tax=Yersinia intermedia TaxID=631 RepID=UPI0030D2D96F